MPYADIDRRRRYQRNWKRKQPESILRKLGHVCSRCGEEICRLTDSIRVVDEYLWITDVLSKHRSIALASLPECTLVCLFCRFQLKRPGGNPDAFSL